MATGYLPSAQERAPDIAFDEGTRRVVPLHSASNEISASWMQLPTSSSPSREAEPETDISNYPSSAAEMRDILLLKIAILSGGRDKQGQSLITFPAKSKNFNFERADIRRTVQYLATVPLAEVRENGFSVIVEARGLQWATVKLILRTLQEALPAQIHATYILCPAPFLQKRQILAGISKEKSKLEFTPLAVSSIDKLTQHIDQRQLTFDLGGTLPYNHEEWIQLRLNLEHFVASYNALMEHTSHLEQQMLTEQSALTVEEVEELLKSHEEFDEQLQKTPKSTLREANDLLASIQQQHGEAGASGLTPDKINAMALIRRLMDNTQQRQEQLNDIWRKKKTNLEGNLQLKLFDNGASKVRNWLKGKVEELQSVEIGSNQASAVVLEEKQKKLEAKAQNVYSDLTQLRRMVDGMTGSAHFATDTVRRQIGKLNSRYAKFEMLLEKRKRLVGQSVRLHTAVDKWHSHFDECILEWKRESTAHSLGEVDKLLGDVRDRLDQLHGLVETLDHEAKSLIDMLQGTNGSTESRRAIRHVGRLMDEVVEKKRKAEQQAGAKRAKLEQYKQLFQCERDAKQASDWLDAMCDEMILVRGSIGNSIDLAKMLLAEQAKFTEKARSTHKYCSELLNSAEAQRQALSLDLNSNLSAHAYVHQVWQSLCAALAEEELRLVRSRDFHEMLEHVTRTLPRWLQPVHDLHRNPASVVLLVNDIKAGRELMMQELSRCHNAANSLLERLCHPLLDDGSRHELNEPTRVAVGYLQGHVEWLAEKRRTLPTSINQQLQLLDVFSRQLAHEQYIEEVLMWLQDIGLPTMTSFCSLGSSLPMLSAQCAEFEVFDETCSGMNEHVGRVQADVESLSVLHPEGSENILKKVGNLCRVWDRFMTRVTNRRQALTATTKFFQDSTSVHTVLSELVSVLSSSDGSLSIDQRQELSETLPCYHQMMLDGSKLAGFLKQCPPDTKDMVVANLVLEKMAELLSLFQELSRLTTIDGHQETGAAKEVVLPEAIRRKGSALHETSTPQRGSSVSFSQEVTPTDSALAKVTPIAPKSVAKIAKATSTVVKSIPSSVKMVVVENDSLGEVPSSADAVLSATASAMSDENSPAISEEETLRKIEIESQKLLDFLGKEIESFLMIYSSVPTVLEKIEKMLSEHQNFRQKIQPTITALQQVCDSVSSLSSVSLRNRGELVSRRALGRKIEMEEQISERVHLFEYLFELCRVLEEVKPKLQELQEFVETDIDPNTSEEQARQRLESKSSLVRHLDQSLKEARAMSDDLLSKMYGVSKLDLSAMDARRFVRQEMRALEGRMKMLSLQWKKKRRFLSVVCNWPLFLESHGRLMAWLQNVGEPFLSSSWKLGTSHKTAEALLDELEEFTKKAESTVAEITSLLKTASEIMVAQDFHLKEVKQKEQVLRQANDRFQALMVHRHKALLLVIEFFKEAEALSQAVDVTVEMVPVTSTTNGVLNPISVVAQLSFLQKRQAQLSALAKQACEIVKETPHLEIDQSDLRECEDAMQRLVQEINHKLERYQLSQEGDVSTSSEQTSLTQQDLEELESFLLDIEKHVEHQLQEQATYSLQSQSSSSDTSRSAKTASLPLSGRRPGCRGDQIFLPKQDSVQNIRQKFEMLSDSSLPSSPTTPSSLSSTERVSTYPPRKKRFLVQSAGASWGIQKEDRTASVPLIIQAKIRTVSSAHQVSMVTVPASKEQSHAQSQPLSQSRTQTQSEPLVQTRPHARSQSPTQAVPEPPTKPHWRSQQDLLPVPSPTRAIAVPAASHQRTSYQKWQGTGKVSQLRELFEAGSTEQLPVSPTLQRMSASPTLRKTPVTSPTHLKMVPSPTHRKIATQDYSISVEQTCSVTSPTEMEVHRPVPIRADKQAIVTCEAPSPLTPVQITIVDLEKGRVDTPPPKRPPTPSVLDEKGKAPPPVPPPPSESEASDQEDRKESEATPTEEIEGKGFSSASQEEGRDSSSWDSRSSPYSEEEESAEEQPESQLTSAAAILTPVEEEEEETLTADSSLGDDQADVGLPWKRAKKARESGEDEQWKKRSLKSLRSTMRKLVVSEDQYLGALYRMVKGYLPLFRSDDLPTFLEGQEEVLFSNVVELFEFHLLFQDQLKTRKESVEGICSCFTENRERFLCYLKYIRDFEHGQQILVAYGGSFLTDFQQLNGWETNLQQDHQHPYDRLNHYCDLLQDLLDCAQKEYLHGVSCIKDAEDVIRAVLLRADIELGVQKLRGCPFKVDHELVLLHGEFFVTVGKKKTMSVYHAFLHEHYLILADLHFSAEAECVLFHFVDCMQTAGMKLIENYHNMKERFAVFSGQTEDMLVFKPCSDDPLMKNEWVTEIKKILWRKAEEAMPQHALQPEQLEGLVVDLEMQGVPVPSGEREAGSRGIKQGSSLKRKGSFKGQDAVHKKEGTMLEGRGHSKSSKKHTVDPTATTSLLSVVLSGVHQPTQEEIEFERKMTYIYMVVKEFLSNQEGQISVSPGELVEVLDEEGSYWLVCTIPSLEDELEREGMVPSSCLLPVRQGDGTILLPELSSNRNNNNCDSLPETTVVEKLTVTSDTFSLGQICQNGNTVGTASTCPTTPASESSTCMHMSPLETCVRQPIMPSETATSTAKSTSKISVHPTTLASGSSTGLPTSASGSSTNLANSVSEASSCLAMSASAVSVDSTLKAKSDASLDLRPNGSQPPKKEVATDALFRGPNPSKGEGGEGVLNREEKQLLLPLRNSPNFFFHDSMTLEAALMMTNSEQEGSQVMDAHMRNVCRVVSARRPQSREDEDDSLKSISDPLVYGDTQQQAKEENVPLSRWSIPSLESGMLPLLEETDAVRVRQASGRELFIQSPSSQQPSQWYSSQPKPTRGLSVEEEESKEDNDNSWNEIFMEYSSDVSPLSYNSHHPSTEKFSSKEPSSNRRSLYSAAFLNRDHFSDNEPPTRAQLAGVFSLRHPYVAVSDYVTTEPTQLSLYKGQPVTVIDSKRDDWWLCQTVSNNKNSLPQVVGWVSRNLLQHAEDIREEKSSYAGCHLSPSPSPLPSLWVVLADYQAREEGTLSVQSGELVEVIDSSRNKWSLVRTTDRQPQEGWVPTSYIKPCDYLEANDSNINRPMSASSSTEQFDPLTVCASPESALEDDKEWFEDEERRKEANTLRECTFSELLSSEKEYIERLTFCVTQYKCAFNAPNSPVPKALRGVVDQLFGNIEDILSYHQSEMILQLEDCRKDMNSLGDVFMLAAPNLKSLYVTYCQGKPRSDDIYQDHVEQLLEIGETLKDRLTLRDYLILPVQRITKYSLLLKNFMKYSSKAGIPLPNFQSVLEVMNAVSTCANNAVHLSMVEGIQRRLGEFGELVLQDVFGVSEPQQRGIFKERRLFLFEHALMMTKKRKDSTDRESYIIRDLLLLPEVSITEDVDTEKRNIILYDMVTGNKFTLKASHGKVRDTWITQANNCIVKAKRCVGISMSRSRSESDPATPTLRSATAHSGSQSLRRQSSSSGSQQRPRSSTRIRPSSATGSRQQSVEPKPGTLYVVMQCIVMMGGDDIQLEPGELVELVRVETSGEYRVRTKDENPIEGVVSPLFLRSRDAVRGRGMETAPKIVQSPSDISVVLGNSARVSCIYNGHPDPDVVWKKDGEAVQSSNRIKISLCPTSSVMEISQVRHSDDGDYSCRVSNTIGSDIAEFAVYVEGPPSAPGRPTAMKITATSAKLRWAVPEHCGHCAITSYQLEQLQEGFEEWQPIVQHTKNSFHVKTLEPSTCYQFRVVAYNESGSSVPSQPSDTICTAPAKGKGGQGRQPISSPVSTKRRRVVEVIIEDFDASNGAVNGLPSPMLKPLNDSATDGYEPLAEELGRGRFGICYKCLHRPSNKEFAAKYTPFATDREPGPIAEVEVLQLVSGTCQHVQQYVDALETPTHVVIITELILGEGLLDYIVCEDHLTEAKIVLYLQQLLSALEHIHLLSIVHLDIKPENILVVSGNPPLLKLIDFGSAVDLSVTNSTRVITPSLINASPEFTAPEVLSNEELTTAADMWSAGVLCYIMLCGVSPFFDENPNTMHQRVCDAKVDFPSTRFSSVSNEAKDLVKSLLQKMSRYRPLAGEVLQHRLLKSARIRSSTQPLPVMARLRALAARRKIQASSVAMDAGEMFGNHGNSDALSPCFSEEEQLDEGVPSRPKLWNGPEILRVVHGDPAVIQWVLGGFPAPSVTWEHNERRLLPSGRIALQTEGGVTSLSITDVVRSDEGMYVCCAVNNFGSDVKETRLLVMDKPSAPSNVTGVMLGEYNSLLVSWLPPINSGNSHITHYILEQRRLDGNSNKWEVVDDQVPSAAHVVDGLLPEVSYSFRVTAVNGIGRGMASKPSPPLSVSADTGNLGYASYIHLKDTDFTAEYELGEMISRTGFVSMYECTEAASGKTFVAKVFAMASQGNGQAAMGEYEMLRQLNHPYLVAMEDAFSVPSHLTLVQEYCAGGDLLCFVSSGPLEESIAIRFTRQMTEGLSYLHKCGIIHANISPSNILLTAGHCDIKISNFASARYVAEPSVPTFTPRPLDYNAPEVLNHQLLTPACDIWSMGVVTLFMLTSEDPFLASTSEETTANILTCHLAPQCSQLLPELSQECINFVINSILIISPQQRLTANQCLRHRWLIQSPQPPSNLPSPEEMGYLVNKYGSHRMQKTKS